MKKTFSKIGLIALSASIIFTEAGAVFAADLTDNPAAGENIQAETAEIPEDYVFDTIEEDENTIEARVLETEETEADEVQAEPETAEEDTKLLESETVGQTDLSEAEVNLKFTSCTYSGTAREPKVTVICGEQTLVEGTDFTVLYENNINAGTASVTVTGIGNYTGTAVKEFKIKAKEVTPTVTLSEKSFTYDKKVKRPAVTVTVNGETIERSGYSLTYDEGRRDVGKYKITVKLKGNYKGTKTVSFSINRAKNSISGVTSKKTLTFRYYKPKNLSFKLSASVKEKAAVTYALSYVPSAAKNYITVSKAGKVTVKKGIKKGTYKIKVKVTAAKTANYRQTTVTKTIKVVVKKKSKPSYPTLNSIGLTGYSSTLDKKLDKHLNQLASIMGGLDEDLFEFDDNNKAYLVTLYIGSNFYYNTGSYSAESMLDTGYGTCFAYSDLTYCMVRKLGISDAWLTVAGRNIPHNGKFYGSQHRSVVVKINGRYFELDSNMVYLFVANGIQNESIYPEEISESYAMYLIGQADSYTSINP